MIAAAAHTLARMHASPLLPLSVTFAVLGAAVTHATWNAIAHGIKDQLVAFGLIGAGGIAVAVPLVVIFPFPLTACWPYLLASVVIHVFYNLLLMRSYRYGDFGQVYPLARGTSPLVVTVLAAVFAAERPSGPQIAGVLVVSLGLACLVLAGRRGTIDRARPGTAGLSRAALLAAAGTGLTIAAYTTVDGLGVRLSGSSVGYIGWLMLLQSMCVPAWALVRRRSALGSQSRRVLASGLFAGALSVLAYGLVLWAQTRGALAPIAALRETSVIFGAVIGTVVFHESFGRWRITATLLVVLGVLLLNAG
jgi:drug/metabolite transporter (DMT)-like permease